MNSILLVFPMNEEGFLSPTAVAHSITGDYVTRIFDSAARYRGYPEAVRTDRDIGES